MKACDNKPNAGLRLGGTLIKGALLTPVAVTLWLIAGGEEAAGRFRDIRQATSDHLWAAVAVAYDRITTAHGAVMGPAHFGRNG